MTLPSSAVGSGGYPAAIRATQLGASVVCVEQEAELGGTCLRVGCIPTKAWVQTALALKQANETFEKLGVKVGPPELDFGAAQQWKDGVVKQLTGGVATLFKANGIEWVKGVGRSRTRTRSPSRAGRTSRSRAPSSRRDRRRSGRPSRASTRSAASTRQASSPRPRCRAASSSWAAASSVASSPPSLARFGSEVTIVEMLPKLIPLEDDDASKELAKQFKKRGIELNLETQCDKVEDTGDGLRVHFGGQTKECDLMLVATGRGPNVEGLGLEEIGVEFDPKKGIAADEHRRTTVPHIYATGDCAGYWQLAHTAFREAEVAAENAMGHEAVVDNRGVPRPIYTDPEIASVGLTEQAAREQYGDDVVTGSFPWVANGRAIMQNETTGWVKTIHESRYGEFLGLVMVGPHVTDLVEAGVVALDAEATIETVADGMTAHPTLSEAIKEAGLVALGRPIHVATRKRTAAKA